MSQSRSGALRIRTRIPSPRRLYVNLRQSSLIKNQENVQLVKLASLSLLHNLTPVFGFLAYRPPNCGLSGTSSVTNSCHSRILNLYLANITCVPLTIPSVRNPRTPVDLSQIHHHSKMSTSSQTRRSHMLVTTLSPPPIPPGVS